MCVNIDIYRYSKTSLQRPTMGPILGGLFREVVGLGSSDICMDDRNKAIDIGEWSICGGGQIERFYHT